MFKILRFNYLYKPEMFAKFAPRLQKITIFMHRLLVQSIPVLFIFSPMQINAQNLGQLMAAKDYHEMKSGPEKTERIRNLERNSWRQQDEIVDHNGNAHGALKTDLTPLVDAQGTPIYLVTELSPEFPGGAAGLQEYLRNRLGDLLAKPNGEIVNTLYIRFTVTQEGKIEAIEPASPFPDWIPAATIKKCLAAVQEMPIWSPGVFKDQAVKVKMLQVFALGQ